MAEHPLPEIVESEYRATLHELTGRLKVADYLAILCVFLLTLPHHVEHASPALPWRGVDVTFCNATVVIEPPLGH